MDASERQAFDYLRQLGNRRLRYEPEGDGKPPDFAVEGGIAVEVTTLHGTDFRDAKSIAIARNAKAVLDSLGAGPGPDASWWVIIDYDHPGVPKKRFEQILRRELGSVRDLRAHGVVNHRCEGIRLRLLPRSIVGNGCQFMLGSCEPKGDAGQLSEILRKRVDAAIQRKTEKMKVIRALYREWWLILIDYISFGVAEPFEVSEHSWDKIVLVHPEDPSIASELPG